MKVEIFITTKFSGKVTKGKGSYGIVLRKAGERATAKVHIAGWRNLSYQKLNARAVVDAIQYMVAPAHVHIILDNAYAEHMIQKGNAGGNAHQELWEIFYKAAGSMKSVEVERITKHEYTDKLLERINAGNYPVIEDRQEESYV